MPRKKPVENILSTPRLPIEDGYTNSKLRFEETDDFGHVLRTLRLNHGTSITVLSKQLGLSIHDISAIERSDKDVPAEAVVSKWLDKLGCTTNKKHLMLLAKKHIVTHRVKMYPKDESNSDMIRLIEAYKNKSLTDYDRALLSVIAR